MTIDPAALREKLADIDLLPCQCGSVTVGEVHDIAVAALDALDAQAEELRGLRTRIDELLDETRIGYLESENRMQRASRNTEMARQLATHRAQMEEAWMAGLAANNSYVNDWTGISKRIDYYNRQMTVDLATIERRALGGENE